MLLRVHCGLLFSEEYFKAREEFEVCLIPRLELCNSVILCVMCMLCMIK